MYQPYHKLRVRFAEMEMRFAATALLCEKATRKNPQIFPGC